MVAISGKGRHHTPAGPTLCGEPPWPLSRAGTHSREHDHQGASFPIRRKSTPFSIAEVALHIKGTLHK